MQELTAELDALVGRGRWDEAEKLLLSARQSALEQGNDSAALSIESERMGFYRMRGNERAFFEAKNSAFSLLERVRIDRRSRGTILINAATGLVAFGRPAEAIELYGETERLYRAVLQPDDRLFAALCNNRASAYRATGDFVNAVKDLRRALTILEKQPHDPDLATTWVNLALLYAAAYDADGSADDALERAAAVFDDPEMIWDEYYAHTAKKCAGAYEDLGRERYAEELRERAEIIYEGT